MTSEYEILREQKDAFFADDPGSPLPDADREGFTGLRYFPVDPDLVLELEVEPIRDAEPVEMATSTGDTRLYTPWGRVRFEVGGTACSLTIFAQNGHLFVPFSDATSGVETYGAGRYLEPEQLADGQVRLDFNHAYNPFCAYSDRWSCPIPPPENRLPEAIRAGERSYR